LKERFPQATIAWAVEQQAAPIVAACRAVDRVIVVPKKFMGSPATGWKVRGELTSLKIDVAIDPQGLSKSASLGWLSQAPRRIGFGRPAGREISPWLNNELVEPRHLHMVDRYLELLRPLGIESPRVEFGLKGDDNAQDWVAGWLKSVGIAGPFAVVNPGAGWDSKRWPAERLGAVANHLAQHWKLPTVVVWAGMKERAWAEEIVSIAPRHAKLAPPTSLRQLTAVLRAARLMVASDTGPLHLAAAVDTPSVGLFGSTSREACGPYGEGCLSIQRALDRSHSRKRRGASNWAVREITVAMANSACDQVLEQARQRDASVLPLDWNLRSTLGWPAETRSAAAPSGQVPQPV
jgi:ADP-heptose:LPS heptosyltransferase